MSALENSRDIPASVDQVFAAIRDPQRLARWWGPDGFTNTFAVFDFTPGGCWNLTMHGPDGRDYWNESVFAEISEPSRVVVRHDSEPKFTLTITLSPVASGTRVDWRQEFESAEFARKMESFLRPCNEQNLDRLTAEVMRKPDGPQ